MRQPRSRPRSGKVNQEEHIDPAESVTFGERFTCLTGQLGCYGLRAKNGKRVMCEFYEVWFAQRVCDVMTRSRVLLL